MAIGDFDGDGEDDLLFSGSGGPEVWLGDGSGTFTPAPPGSTTGSRGALVADIDTDGDLDVLDPESAVRVFAGNGDGTFASPHDAYVLPISQSRSEAIQAADWDSDGDVDLVVPWIVVGSGGVYLLDNDGTGQLSQSNFFAFDPSASAIYDLNDDSKLDLVVAVADQIRVWLGDGDGAFEGVTGLRLRAKTLDYLRKCLAKGLLRKGSAGFVAGPDFVFTPAGDPPVLGAVEDAA